MADLRQRLRDARRSGVYRAARTGEIGAAVKGSDLALSWITVDAGSILQSIAKALDFPDWFGENWDALEDCLTDLSWRDAAGHVLVFEGFGALPVDERAKLIDVLASAAQFWAEQGRSFFAVVADPGGALELPDLLRAP